MSKGLLKIVSGFVLLLVTLEWRVVLSVTPGDLASNAIQIIVLLFLSVLLICIGFGKLER